MSSHCPILNKISILQSIVQHKATPTQCYTGHVHTNVNKCEKMLLFLSVVAVHTTLSIAARSRSALDTFSHSTEVFWPIAGYKISVITCARQNKME